MKRPLFLLLIGLVLGEAAAISFGWNGVLIPALFLLMCRIILKVTQKKQSCFYLYGWKKTTKYVSFLGKNKNVKKIFLILFAAMYLLGAFGFVLENEKSPVDWKLEEKRLNGTVTGTIVQLKIKEDIYQILVDNVLFTEENDGKKIFLKEKCRISQIDRSFAVLMPGDFICCGGTLSPLEEPTNPGQFNSKVYDRSNGIRYQFFGESCKVLREKKLSFRGMAYLIRCKIAAVYENILSETEAALLQAMVLGDKSELSQEQKLLYEENGVAHLLAVSGMHISIVGGTLFRFFRKRGLGYGFSWFGGGVILLFYGCMTGFGSSVVRAVFMYLIYLGAQYLGVEYDMISAMSLSGIFMLLEHPFRILDGGFQISFASIAAIGFVLPWVEQKIEKRKKREAGELFYEKKWILQTKKALTASLVINAVTAPLIMRIFYEWCPYNILLNLFVLPCMVPLMLSGIISGLAGIFDLLPAFFLSLPASFLLRIFDILFMKVRKLPGAVFVTGCPAIWQMCVLYLIEILFFSFWYFHCWKGIIFSIGIGIMGICFCSNQMLHITMLDVGQGECIFIKMPDGKGILIDGGSAQKSKIGEYIIIPALKYYGVNHLDQVVITHTDADHISGIEELLDRNYPIRSIFLPGVEQRGKEFQRILQKGEQNQTEIIMLNRGDRINLGQVSFSCLHPYSGFQNEDKNAGSIVLYMKYGNFDALFTGDLDISGEEQVTEYILEHKEEYPALWGETEILKVAHHGSKYSTEMPFLRLISPKIALISSGKGNRYGHPHKELMERLQKQKLNVFQTQKRGAIVMKTDGQSYQIRYFKKSTAKGRSKFE